MYVIIIAVYCQIVYPFSILIYLQKLIISSPICGREVWPLYVAVVPSLYPLAELNTTYLL